MDKSEIVIRKHQLLAGSVNTWASPTADLGATGLRIEWRLPGTDPAAFKASAGALLVVYEHARAQALLARLGLAATGPGPRLGTPSAPPPPPVGAAPALMVEDLGAVDPAITEAWMRWSLQLTAQPREGSAWHDAAQRHRARGLQPA